MRSSPQLVIRSGGQTGADVAALDWAIANSVPHAGWCPRGRRSEAGRIDDRYQLTETPSGDYSQRTEWNVRDSDATVVFSVSTALSGGSLFTEKCARKHRKPCLHLAAERTGDDHAALLTGFIEEHRVKVLNIADRGSPMSLRLGASFNGF